jgi:hypothetical protein
LKTRLPLRQTGFLLQFSSRGWVLFAWIAGRLPLVKETILGYTDEKESEVGENAAADGKGGLFRRYGSFPAQA